MFQNKLSKRGIRRTSNYNVDLQKLRTTRNDPNENILMMLQGGTGSENLRNIMQVYEHRSSSKSKYRVNEVGKQSPREKSSPTRDKSFDRTFNTYTKKLKKPKTRMNSNNSP